MHTSTSVKCWVSLNHICINKLISILGLFSWWDYTVNRRTQCCYLGNPRLPCVCQEDRPRSSTERMMIFTCNVSSNFRNGWVSPWIQYRAGCRDGSDRGRKKQVNQSDKCGDKALASSGREIVRSSERYLPSPGLMIKRPPDPLTALSLYW